MIRTISLLVSEIKLDKAKQSMFNKILYENYDKINAQDTKREIGLNFLNVMGAHYLKNKDLKIIYSKIGPFHEKDYNSFLLHSPGFIKDINIRKLDQIFIDVLSLVDNNIEITRSTNSLNAKDLTHTKGNVIHYIPKFYEEYSGIDLFVDKKIPKEIIYNILEKYKDVVIIGEESIAKKEARKEIAK